MNYQKILEIISDNFNSILKNNLVGIYVHGSIAFGCFNWDKSDIDFLVVVNNELSISDKLSLLNVLDKLIIQVPPKGLEMSVVLKKHCVKFKYPTPFELHFSNMWLDAYKNNPEKFCSDMHGVDKDLAAHFTVTKKVGITLYGLPINEVFGCVPKSNYIDSIKNDIMDCKLEIMEKPMYNVLTLCRVLAYVKDDLITSKEQGGNWGINNLSDEYKNLVIHALNSYKTNEKMIINERVAQKFCDYMLEQIQIATY